MNSLRRPRSAALASIIALVVTAAVASFTESYRALITWATAHGLHGLWAATFPAQIDSFIAVGELALFVALADQWSTRSRSGAWLVTGLGLLVSVAANVGHVAGHDLAFRFTAAVPPLAASAALAVGLGVLKRVVATRAGAAMMSSTSQPVSVDLLTARTRPSLRLAWPLPAVTGTPAPEATVRQNAATEPDRTPVTQRSTSRTPKPSTTAARVAAIVRKQPDISGAELGRKLGVSERTGRRYLAEGAA